MKHIQIALLCSSILAFPAKSFGQKQKQKPGNPENPDKAIKAVINRFFEGMEKGDTALLKSSCTANMVLQTYMADKEGKMQVYTEDLADFLTMVSSPGSDQYDERIRFETIHAEKSLASV